MSTDEPLIRGWGNSEESWFSAPWLGGTPEITSSELFGSAKRLVVVAPHPDDEVLGCGGLIWTAARAKLPVRIISASAGEACFGGEDAAPLAAARRAELVAALRELGVPTGSVESLGLPDGALQSHESTLRAEFFGSIQSSDLVLGTWEQDGHPDHEAVGRAARAATLRRGARYASYPIWAWHWLDPLDAPRRLPGAVRVFPSADALNAKRAAIMHFRSQLGGWNDQPAIVPPRVLARFLRDFEVFVP